MGNFESELARLNNAQKEAVQTTEGPVLVIAGPGTGKTQLLSMRVANIIRSTDTDPSNILCLTFTNKAALNMRERLLSLAGSEANKATVKTFHSFAAELMSRYPDFFWNGARLSTAPDAIQLETVQNILAKLPLSNPLSMRFAGQFTGVDDTIKALRLAKEAGLTPDKLRAIIQTNLVYIDLIESELTEILSQTLSAKKVDQLKESIHDLPEQGIDASIAPLLSLSTVMREGLETAIKNDEGTGKTKHLGKWKARWVQNQNGQKGMFNERKRNEWWLAFCDVYSKYRDNLHKRGYYDYSDMLLEVIVQLEQNPDLLAEVQEQFHYVLLDEFQDSNAAQLRLAHLVADHHTAEGLPNIMAVGDDDQSIFGFNGAELNNMLFFDRNYKSTKKVVLEDNYRSSPGILDTTEKIITQAEDRLVKKVPGLSKKLIARNPPKDKGSISHLSYSTREHQLSSVARSIKDVRKRSSDSIAVLARSHESLRTLSAILLKLDVPVRYERQSNILEHEIIKQVILICEAIAAIDEGNKSLSNEKIAQLVRHPMWQIDDRELWDLAISNFRSGDWLRSLQKSADIHQKQLGNWLIWLSREATYQPLTVTLEHVLGLSASQHLTSPIREYYLTQRKITDDYLHSLSAVRLLRELVNEFSSEAEASVGDFLRFIKINSENGRGVTDESMFVSSHDAVELYTVHKAKGLEFGHVFIIDAIEDNWKPRIAGRKPPANLPLQPPGEQDEDYIRLLYVAVTRAKHSLTVTSYRFNHAGKEVLASPFITEVIPPETAHDSDALTEIQILEENLRWPRLAPKEEKASLEPRLENYKLNATHLLNFLDIVNCGPQYFFERHILGIPEAKTANQGFGNAMHRTMQAAQNLTNQKKLNINEIKKVYQQALKSEHLEKEDYEKYLQYGQEALDHLFKKLNFALTEKGMAEQRIESIQVGKAILTGIIDNISNTEKETVISDYKTGTPLNSFTTRDQTKAVKAWRHQSQLVFYALLYQKWPSAEINKNLTCQIVYLEAETEKELIRTNQPSPEEITRLEMLANAVWNKIINLDFPDTSSYTPDVSGIKQFEEDLLNGK
jgi:DNA helicase-2/ATP-dependent DNA helicase PcrA